MLQDFSQWLSSSSNQQALDELHKLKKTAGAWYWRLIASKIGLVVAGSFGLWASCALLFLLARVSILNAQSSTSALPYAVVPITAIVVLFLSWFPGLCERVKSETEHSTRVWLYLLGPRLREGSELTVLAGTLSPEHFGGMFPSFVAWLKHERKVRLRIAAATPPTDQMTTEQRQDWEKVLKSYESLRLNESMRLLSARAPMEFVLGPDFVRVESRHDCWVTRPPGTIVTNDVSFWSHGTSGMLRARFDELWEHAKRWPSVAHIISEASQDTSNG
jgi:hypothetical protein